MSFSQSDLLKAFYIYIDFNTVQKIMISSDWQARKDYETRCYSIL